MSTLYSSIVQILLIYTFTLKQIKCSHQQEAELSLEDGGGFYTEEISRNRIEDAYSLHVFLFIMFISLFIDNMVSILSIKGSAIKMELHQWLRLASHDNDLNTNPRGGVAFPLFIPRLDERLWGGNLRARGDARVCEVWRTWRQRVRDQSRREHIRAHFSVVHPLDGNAAVERFYDFHSGGRANLFASVTV